MNRWSLLASVPRSGMICLKVLIPVLHQPPARLIVDVSYGFPSMLLIVVLMFAYLLSPSGKMTTVLAAAGSAAFDGAGA